MTNIYFLWVAIKICGSRNRLSELTGIDVDRISEWLSGSRAITLKNAMKIEKVTNWRVTRDQLVSDRDKAYIATLKAEVEILKRSQPPLSFIQQVELGLAHEAALGCRKGARTDLSLRENFPEVIINFDDILDKKLVLRGRTEEIAVKLVGLGNYKIYFGNYKTYQQAKKIVKNGVPELPEAVNKGLSIFRAFKISEHPSEKQLYLLGLDSSSMAKALCEAEAEKGAYKWKKMNNDSKVHTESNAEKKDCSEYEAVAAWALTSFNVTLFQNKNAKRMRDEEKQICEGETILRKTTIPN